MIAKARSTTSPVIPSMILDEDAPGVWGLKVSLPQLIVGWVAISSLMLLVFLFGLYAGRRQGVELALEEQSTPKLRLPVSDSPRAALKGIENESPVAKNEDRFNFGAVTETLKPAESEPAAKPLAQNDSAGFIGKAVNEVIVEPKAPMPAAEKPPTLSESVAKVELSPSLRAPSIQAAPPKIQEPIKVVEAPKVREVAKAAVVVAPKPVTKVTKVEKKIVEPVKSSGLFVQVAAPDSATQAQNLVNKLRSRGITAAVRDANVSGKLHYRVLVGPFSSRPAAESAKTQVVKSGVASGEPFIKNY